VEDGVISFSLRDMTLVGCIAITTSLLFMLYKGCTEQKVACSWNMLPMISDVICLPFYDRVFCLITMYFTFACYQVDVRAFYNKINGLVSSCTQDTLLVCGILTTFSLPAIGYFDEHNYGSIHGVMAVTFFLSVAVYAYMLADILEKNKQHFPQLEWEDIDRMHRLKWIMVLSLGAFLYSCTIKGWGYWLTPFAEWTTTLIYVNYLALLSFINDYYDSVHPYTLSLS